MKRSAQLFNQNDTSVYGLVQENISPVTKNIFYKSSSSSLDYRETSFSEINLGDRVVTHQLTADVAFEEKLQAVLPRMPKNYKKVFNALLKLDADCKEIWFSQVRLAKKLGMGLSTVKRALGWMKKHGIVEWTFRGVKRTCLYKLSDHLSSKSLRSKFVSIVSGFKYVPMSVLLSRNAHLFEGACALSSEVKIKSEPQGTNVENIFSQSLSLNKFIYKRGLKLALASLSVYLTARAREEYSLAPLFLSKKQEMVVSKSNQVYSQSLAIAAAANVKSLKLTAYGRLIASSYPAEAQKWADAEMAKKKGAIQKPMGLFCSLCKQYCEKNGVLPNFSRLQQFRAENPEHEQLDQYEEAPALAPSNKSSEEKSSISAKGLAEAKRQAYFNSKAKGKFKSEEERIEAALRLGVPEEAMPSAQGPVVMDYAQERQIAVDILKAKRANGERLNAFQEMMIGDREAHTPLERLFQASAPPAPPAAPAAPISTKETQIPLEVQDMELINGVIMDRHKLPERQSSLLMEKISGVMAQGAQHPTIRDGSFRAGMRHIKQVLETIANPQKVANSQ